MYQEVTEQTERPENEAKKTSGNQGNIESHNIAEIMPQVRRTQLPDTSHGYHLPPQGTDGIATGRTYPVLSGAFASLAIVSVSPGSLRLARQMLFARAWPPGLKDSDDLAFWRR